MLAKIHVYSISALLLLAVPTIGLTDKKTERWYDVDLVFFQKPNAEYFYSEQWPSQWTVPDTENAVVLTDIQTEYTEYFQTLDSETGALTNAVAALEKSSRYDVIAHIRWRQQGLSQEQAIEVLIQTGRRYHKIQDTATNDNTITLQNNTIEYTQTVSDTEPAQQSLTAEEGLNATQQYRLADDSDTEIIYELEGSVKLVLSRFLHVYTDLLLKKPINLSVEQIAITDIPGASNELFETAGGMMDEAVPAEQKIRIDIADPNKTFTTLHGFNIQQHRRVRSQELHHLDHPLLSILVNVTPVTED